MIKSVIPTDEKHWLEMRRDVITSTEVSALFGASKYLTPFELWYRKKEKTVVDFDMNERMKWGLRLEKSIAEGVAEENGWTVKKKSEFIFDDVLKVGASFDYEISIGESAEKGILEVKNVDSRIFKDDWLENDDGTFEASPYIECQIQAQLMLSGYAFAFIAALVGGNKVILIKRTPDPVIIDAIKAKVVQFWQSIEKNTPPPPDFQADSGFISKLYGFADAGKILSAETDEEIAKLAAEHKKHSDAEKAAKEAKDAIKAQLLMKIGDCEKVLCNGFSITAGMVGPAHIEFDREGYRNFRINWPRAKKEKK